MRGSKRQDDPELRERCRLLYEKTETSFRAIAVIFGIPRAVVTAWAKEEGWVPFAPVSNGEPGNAEATLIETELLVEGLKLNEVQRKLIGRQRVGRPKADSRYVQFANSAPMTEEQHRIKCAREEFEGNQVSLTKLATKYGFSLGKIAYIAKQQEWKKRPKPEGPTLPEEPPDRPKQPASKKAEKRGWKVIEGAPEPQTADILAFPTAPATPPTKVAELRLLPERSVEERQMLRQTLAAIRAAMSVEQVQELEHHQALLRRYSHLIEVYLEPQRFVDLAGLSNDQAADRIVAAQQLALRMLLPTERDTLAGAIKTLTDSLARTIAMKRAVANLDKAPAGAFRSGDPDNPAAGDDLPGKGLDVDAMDTTALQAVQRAMEMVDRHHKRHLLPPIPPPPDSIEDLMGPEAVVVQEPEPEPDPDIPER